MSNASLIAAAPDLLEALYLLSEYAENQCNGDGESEELAGMCLVARAAIAKAQVAR